MVETVDWWMWIVGFLLVLGPLITVHELGHYLVGRWFGVKADAFSVGFGKEIVGRTDKRGTRWKLCALPLGGYVQFAGDINPASTPNQAWLDLPEDERAKTFNAQPLWQKALIVAAGPVTNFLLAIAILATFNFAYGRIVSSADVVGFEEVSDARKAGVEIGDRIVAIDGKEVESRFDVNRYSALYPGKTISLTIERGGREISIPVTLSPIIQSDPYGNESMVGDLGIDFIPPVVGSFVADSPAKDAGLEVGDIIAEIDGNRIDNYQNIVDFVGPRPGETVLVSVRRGDATLQFPVSLAAAVPPESDERTSPIGVLGIYASPGDVVPVGPLEAVSLGVSESAEIMSIMITGLGQIIAGDRSVKEMGGPIKIAKFSGEQLSRGPEPFVLFIALISINLGFINLLPIPALDGGHLAFYAVEAVRRKPVGPRSQEWAFRTGIALVLALMLFVTINDIASLPIFGN